jgi:fimbrial chaperone protein
MPVKLDMTVPQVADKIIVTNGDSEPVNLQIRVFKWTTVKGVDQLSPTSDVVASPPAARVAAKGQYVVRVVRVAKMPVSGEERYRLLVDQIPDPKKSRPGTVSFALRMSLPVFFRNTDAADAKVAWSVRQTLKGLVVGATNSGDRTLRVSDLLVLSAGRVVARKKGLVGYVQGRATAEFPLDAVKGTLKGTIRLKAQTDKGVVDATLPIGN